MAIRIFETMGLFGDEWVPTYEYKVEGTPCGKCIELRELLVVADKVADLFPGDSDLGPLGAASYAGTAFFDETGERLLGHLAVLDREPIRDPERFSRVFRIFANRAGAELRRANLERALLSRTKELDAIVSSAMDAILIIDEGRDIVRANAAAAAALGTDCLEGEMIDRFLSVERAIITGEGGRLNLSRALPESAAPSQPLADPKRQAAQERVYTEVEMNAMERENLLRALQASGGRISGPEGAATLLGIKPTTLRSRLSAFGINPKDELSA